MEIPRTETFRKVLEKDPDNPMILCSLGIELFKEGRYPEARQHLTRAVENKPDYSVAYRMLGRTHFELRENAQASRVFARGREVAQENGDLQTVREIDVFLRRLDKREAGEG
jgi:predicted Zn-dependent protease